MPVATAAGPRYGAGARVEEGKGRASLMPTVLLHCHLDKKLRTVRQQNPFLFLKPERRLGVDSSHEKTGSICLIGRRTFHLHIVSFVIRLHPGTASDVRTVRGAGDSFEIGAPPRILKSAVPPAVSELIRWSYYNGSAAVRSQSILPTPGPLGLEYIALGRPPGARGSSWER